MLAAALAAKWVAALARTLVEAWAWEMAKALARVSALESAQVTAKAKGHALEPLKEVPWAEVLATEMAQA